MITGDQVPKYKFNCDYCHKQWWEWMSIKDPPPTECPHCEQGKPYKVPTNFVTKRKQKEEKKSAKENVIDHIEENRKILKQMKAEATK
jgi:putative FmdB family regulatory protein